MTGKRSQLLNDSQETGHIVFIQLFLYRSG